MRLSINAESVQVLRDFADKIPIAKNQIHEQTMKLMKIYDSVADLIGVHKNDFFDILMRVKKAEEHTSEALEYLLPKLRETADKMEAYIQMSPLAEYPSSSGNKVDIYHLVSQEEKCKVIGSFCDSKVGKYYNVIGNMRAGFLYERYRDSSVEDYDDITVPSFQRKVEYVDPNYIEGIRVEKPVQSKLKSVLHLGRNILSKEQFWELGRAGYERYKELASHIPEVNRRLRGLSLGEKEQEIKRLRVDPLLGNCVLLYFTQGVSQMIETIKVDEIWVSQGEGRHRILAARDVMEEARKQARQDGTHFCEEDYYIPTIVTKRYVYSKKEKNQERENINLEKNRTEEVSKSVHNTEGLRQLKYYHKLNEMINRCIINPLAVNVWNKYKDQVIIGEDNCRIVAHCSKMSPVIYINAAVDEKGSAIHTPYQITVHESAHAIDVINKDKGTGIGWGFSSKYQNGKFPKTIVHEVNSWIDDIDKKIQDELKIHKNDFAWLYKKGYIDYEMYQYFIHESNWMDGIAVYSEIFAYKEIENEIKSIPLKSRANLSDILQGASHEKLQCGIGHDGQDGKSYWDEENTNLAAEAFAEMLDATLVNRESLECIKKYLPKSYAVFEEILQELGK